MKPETKLFKSNPNAFIEQTVKDYVAGNDSNRLDAFKGEPIFDEPLVAFADGDDPIFTEFKKIIGNFHLTPREVLALSRQERGRGDEPEPKNVGVISWILPISRETRLSLRRENRVTSLRWNHTRHFGQMFQDKLSQYVVSVLAEFGYQAVTPDLAGFFEAKQRPTGRASNWSQRHVAYAAGLGTFSLSDGFITPKGIAMRCGSVVSDVAFVPGHRTCANHLANCLFYTSGTCRRCIERCPAGAITERGHDKEKCRIYQSDQQASILKEMGRGGYFGSHLGCGLCQTKVPCEDRIPPHP